MNNMGILLTALFTVGTCSIAGAAVFYMVGADALVGMFIGLVLGAFALTKTIENTVL